MISYPLSWLLSSACTCSLGSCWAGAGSGISGGALSSSASSAGFGLVPSESDHIHIHCTTEGYLWITEVGPVAVLNTTRCTCVCQLLHLKIFWLTGLSGIKRYLVNPHPKEGGGRHLFNPLFMHCYNNALNFN